MTMTFREIDITSNVPGEYMETVFDLAAATEKPYLLLLIGQMITGEGATANEVIEVSREDYARVGFGSGSQLCDMYLEAKKAWPRASIHCLPLADPDGGAKAAGTITFVGTATKNHSLTVYVGDIGATVNVLKDDTAADVATDVAAAFAAALKPDSPATVAVNGEVDEQLDITAKNAGVLGNDIMLYVKYSELGAGVTDTVVDMASGSGTVDLSTEAIATAIKQSGRNYLGFGVNDATNGGEIDDILTHLWHGMVGKPTVASMGSSAAYADLVTLGTSTDAKHLVIVGEPSAATPWWKKAAYYIAERARRDALVSCADALQNHRVKNWLPAWSKSDWLSLDEGEVDTLLKRGITPVLADANGVPQIVLDVWSKCKDDDGNYLGSQFMTRSGILARRHYLVLARWKRARFGDENWQRRVVTKPVEVEVGDGTIMQSDQSKAFALMAYDQDKILENEEKILNYVEDLGFENYEHQVISYEEGKIGVASTVYPAPPLIVVAAQQRASNRPPEEV